MICQKQNTHPASKFAHMMTKDTVLDVKEPLKKYPHGVIGQRNNNSLA